MTDIEAYWYLYESIQRELSNEYQKELRPCALDENKVCVLTATYTVTKSYDSNITNLNKGTRNET